MWFLAVASFFMLSNSSKKEGIDFKHDHWIYMVVGSAFLGAVSGLYDRYLMAPVNEGGAGLDKMIVQSLVHILPVHHDGCGANRAMVAYT